MEVKSEPSTILVEESCSSVQQSGWYSPYFMRTNAAKQGLKKDPSEDELKEIKNTLIGEPYSKRKITFKEKKKLNRFNGVSEEEVSKLTLPDHIIDNLDILIIGINPGLFSAYKGHHYAGPGNHFWKCMHLSGLTSELMTAYDDYKLVHCGIGFTNIVARATRGSSDLSRNEIKEGSKTLIEKLQKYKPRIAVFNGKQIFEVFSGKKNFNYGKQPEFIEGTNTYIWVMPSSSARYAQLPRAVDKAPYYVALKKFKDYLSGSITELDETEIVFSTLKSKKPT